MIHLWLDMKGFSKHKGPSEERFTWRGLEEEILRHARECDVCKRNKG